MNPQQIISAIVFAYCNSQDFLSQWLLQVKQCKWRCLTCIRHWKRNHDDNKLSRICPWSEKTFPGSRVWVLCVSIFMLSEISGALDTNPYLQSPQNLVRSLIDLPPQPSASSLLAASSPAQKNSSQESREESCFHVVELNINERRLSVNFTGCALCRGKTRTTLIWIADLKRNDDYCGLCPSQNSCHSHWH